LTGVTESQGSDSTNGKDDNTIEITVSKLLRAFGDDSKKADQAYLGKALLVSGSISSIKGEFVELFDVNDHFLTTRVKCIFDEAERKSLVSQSIGNQVKIQGVCDGKRESAVELKNCKIFVAPSAPYAPGTAKREQPTGALKYWLDTLREGKPGFAQEAHNQLVAMGLVAIPELRHCLQDQQVSMRVAVASVLGDMGENAKTAIDDLSLALGDDQAPVRTAVAKALGTLGASAHAAFTPMLLATADVNSGVSAAAVAALPRLGPLAPDDVGTVLKAWKQPDAWRRERCLVALRSLKLENAVAVSLFVPLLDDSEKPLRIKAMQAIGEVGPPAHPQTFAKLLSFACDEDQETWQSALPALAKLGPAVVADRKDLESSLHCKTAEVQIFCVERLADIGEEASPSASEVARLTHGSDPKLRAASVRTLVRIGKTVAGTLAEVAKATRDENADVRLAAVESLGRYGREQQAVDAIFVALTDEAKEVRAASAKTLTGLNPPLGRDDQGGLSAALKSTQIDARRFAAAEFARLGKDADSSLSTIMDAANDGDYQVRRDVFVALAAFGAKASASAPVVLQTMTDIVDANGKQDGSVELFTQAAATLDKIGDLSKALPVMNKGLKVDNLGVRKAAVQAMGAAGAPARAMLKDICSLLDQAETAPAASDALLKMRGDDVVKALCDVVDYGRSTQAKVAAIQVLGKMGTDARNAVQTLTGALSRNKGKEIGNAAAEALKLVR
jgi:HEAT repeat protein